MKFENMRKRIEEVCDSGKYEIADKISNGDRFNKDWALNFYLDDEDAIKYKSKIISRETAVEIATKEAFKQIENDKKDELDFLSRAEDAEEIDFIDIEVTWEPPHGRSYPLASIKTNVAGVNTESRDFAKEPSGAESAAIARGLNSIPSIMKLLYAEKDRFLSNGNYGKRPVSEERNNMNVFGLGFGGYVMPMFSVNDSATDFWTVFTNLGFTVDARHEKERSVYKIRKESGNS